MKKYFLDTSSKTISERTYIPLRVFVEALNFKIDWFEKEKKIAYAESNLGKEIKNITYKIVDGVELKLDIYYPNFSISKYHE